MAVSEDMRNCTHTMLLQHRMMDVVMVTRSEHNLRTLNYFGYENGREIPVFYVERIVAKRNFVLRVDERFPMYQIDPEPRFIERIGHDLDSMRIFAPFQQSTPQDIIVEPADVSALLEQITRMQSGEQKAIRDRNSARDRRENAPKLVHAQILSFPKAA